MNQIKVEFLDKMGSDLSVSNSARVSFAKWKDALDSGDEKLIGYLAEHEHMTPFRHNQIQVRCKAPIFIARQLGKHQAGLSWNEVSRRYVDSEPEFYTPDEWRVRPTGSVKQGSGAEVIDKPEFRCVDYGSSGYYVQFLELMSFIYNGLLEQGVAPEQARMVLPQSMMTEWVWTGNLLSFFHVYRLRIDAHAQVEAQEFAKQLESVIEPLFPVSWKALKDACS